LSTTLPCPYNLRTKCNLAGPSSSRRRVVDERGAADSLAQRSSNATAGARLARSAQRAMYEMRVLRPGPRGVCAQPRLARTSLDGRAQGRPGHGRPSVRTASPARLMRPATHCPCWTPTLPRAKEKGSHSPITQPAPTSPKPLLISTLQLTTGQI
jgi:hypothetical protein